MTSILARYSQIFRCACFAGAVAIVIGLFWVGTKQVAVGLFPDPWDKVAHFATFGLIAALLWLSLLRDHPFIVIAVVTLIGMADELHQHYLPGRSANMGDLAVDMLSAALIVALLGYLQRPS